jgi:hypothetical protein
MKRIFQNYFLLKLFRVQKESLNDIISHLYMYFKSYEIRLIK